MPEQGEQPSAAEAIHKEAEAEVFGESAAIVEDEGERVDEQL